MKGGRKFDQERKEPWRWTLMITSDKSASRKSVHRLTELEGVLMTRFTALCATRLGQAVRHAQPNWIRGRLR